MTEPTVETRDGRSAIRVGAEQSGLSFPTRTRKLLYDALDLLDARDDALAAVEARVRELEGWLVALKNDPAAVWVNILRGEIARPQALDHYEATVRRLDEAQSRIAELEARLAAREATDG